MGQAEQLADAVVAQFSGVTVGVLNLGQLALCVVIITRDISTVLGGALKSPLCIVKVGDRGQDAATGI